MGELKDMIHIRVEHFTGREEEDDVGHPYYVASCDELMFTTDGDTFEEMLANVRECLILCLHDTDSVVEYKVPPNARVQLIMDISEDYAQIA
jgi:predicted RNase H-like HicB family nuclease